MLIQYIFSKFSLSINGVVYFILFPLSVYFLFFNLSVEFRIRCTFGSNEVARISVSMGKKTSTKSLHTILANQYVSLSVLTTTLTFFGAEENLNLILVEDKGGKSLKNHITKCRYLKSFFFLQDFVTKTARGTSRNLSL